MGQSAKQCLKSVCLVTSKYLAVQPVCEGYLCNACFIKAESQSVESLKQ